MSLRSHSCDPTLTDFPFRITQLLNTPTTHADKTRQKSLCIRTFGTLNVSTQADDTIDLTSERASQASISGQALYFAGAL